MDRAFVDNAIPKDTISQDMDLELSHLFPKNIEACSIAIEILTFLSEKECIRQRRIAEQLQIPDYRLSRIIQKLEHGRYIKREKIGLENNIRLVQEVEKE